MKDFKFKKGNMEDLEGRVVIASQHVVPFRQGEGQFYLLYGTYDKDALVEKADEGKISADIVDMTIDVAEIQEQDNPWYELPLPPVSSELELMALPERIVLDAGRHYHEFTTTFALQATMKRYHNHIDGLVKSGQFKQDSFSDTYESFKGKQKEMLDHMNFKYINPMIFAKLEGNSSKLESLKRKFMKFFEGSQFYEDAHIICRGLKTLSGMQPDTKVIDKIAEKIAAINGEDFETAARLKKELESLN